MTRRARVQRREALDLATDLGRGGQQEPPGTVGADGHALLGSCDDIARLLAHAATVRAAAVPLRRSTSRCRTQYSDAHGSPKKIAALPIGQWPLRRAAQSSGCPPLERVRVFPVEIVLIGVDLGVHLDLYEGGRFPRHW